MNASDMEAVKQTLRNYIMEEFLPGEDASQLQNDTGLISGRILDSLATLQLTQFLQDRFDVEVRPEEMTEEYLDSIDRIADLIASHKAS
jgi:acyl carrier protein